MLWMQFSLKGGGHADSQDKESKQISEKVQVARKSRIPLRQALSIQQLRRCIPYVTRDTAVVARRDASSNGRAAKVGELRGAIAKDNDIGRLEILVRYAGAVQLLKASGRVMHRAHGPRHVEVGICRSHGSCISTCCLEDRVLHDFTGRVANRNASISENADHSGEISLGAAFEQVTLKVIRGRQRLKSTSRIWGREGLREIQGLQKRLLTRLTLDPVTNGEVASGGTGRTLEAFYNVPSSRDDESHEPFGRIRMHSGRQRSPPEV